MPATDREFPYDRGTAREARRFVAETLRDFGLEDLLDSAELLTSELVANAFIHARSAASVRIAAEGTSVLIEVRDRSPVLPVRKRYETDATTGRGMMLVETLAAQWGAAPEGSGKRVWFVLDAEVTRSTSDLVSAAAGSAAQAIVDDVDLDALAASFGELGEETSSNEPSGRLVMA